MAPKPVPIGVPPETVSHLSNNPLAISTLNDPSFEIHPLSRTVTHHGRGHTLMAGTWNTSDTIAHLLSFYRAPAQSLAQIGDANSRAEVRRFYTFGTGMNAHPDILHGGVVASVLDSTMGNVIGFAMPEARRTGMFTVQLSIKYKKPVRTPGTVMARSWILRIEEEGRKVWVRGLVEGGNCVHASAEGLWVRAKGRGKGKEEDAKL